MLDAGRVATMKRWLSLAERTGSQHPAVLLAEAELALREGDEGRALAAAEHAGGLFKRGELAARSYLIAARAAHLQSNVDAFARNASAARDLAVKRSTLVGTLWLQFIQAIETNGQQRAQEVLRQLEDVRDSSATHALRIRSARAFFAFEVQSESHRAAAELEAGRGLLHHVTDPMLRTHFQNVSSIVAVYRAEYERAVELTNLLHEESREMALEFPIDHALVTRAWAYIGMRKLAEAREVLRELEDRPSSASTFIQQQILLKRAHLRIAVGDLERARLYLQGDTPAPSHVGATSEWFGTKAVICAASGQFSEAHAALEAGKQATPLLDGRNLSRVARAIVEIQVGADGGSLNEVTETMAAGNLDVVVFGCRAFPRLAFELHLAFSHERHLPLRRASARSGRGRAASAGRARESRPRPT